METDDSSLPLCGLPTLCSPCTFPAPLGLPYRFSGSGAGSRARDSTGATLCLEPGHSPFICCCCSWAFSASARRLAWLVWDRHSSRLTSSRRFCRASSLSL